MNNATTSAINPTRDAIAARAYELWEQSGRCGGRALEHWLQAEQQLRAAKSSERLEAATAAQPSPPPSIARPRPEELTAAKDGKTKKLLKFQATPGEEKALERASGIKKSQWRREI